MKSTSVDEQIMNCWHLALDICTKKECPCDSDFVAEHVCKHNKYVYIIDKARDKDCC